jgi:hypothetical protein
MSVRFTGHYNNIALDHFVPINWGSIVSNYGIGGTTYANMIPLSRVLNSSKGSMNPFLWFERYGERHGISLEKWNDAVQYVAEKHKMTTFDYISRVTECYSEILAVKWITSVNSRIESRGYIHDVDISNALKMKLNISLVVELYGSDITKKVFLDNETINLINRNKADLESRLKTVK